MARKFRRFSRRTRRKYRRRGFRGRKSLRSKVASLNRRLAAEVKKNDNAIFITRSYMTQLTNVGVHDWCYLYPVFDESMRQGTQMDDIVGSQLKMKYLYLAFHLQQACNATYPVTLRILVVQDRNYRQYSGGVPTPVEMFSNLFGFTKDSTNTYVANVDTTLLPYNPLEPGRFRIIRDFKMRTSPTGSADNYRKLIILQRHTNSRGRIYFGPASTKPTLMYPNYVQDITNPGEDNFYIMYPVSSTEELPELYVDSTKVNKVNNGQGRYGYSIPGTLNSAFWQQYPGGAIPINGSVPAYEGEPADQDISYTANRNGIYVVILRQATPTGTTSITSQEPDFGLSIQSRFAYYDN